MKTSRTVLLVVRACLLAAILGAFAFAQNVTPNDDATHFWESKVAGVPSLQVVPTSATLVSPAPRSPLTYVRVIQANLSSVSASPVTVTFTDGSTNCNGGACQTLPTITLQPNQKVTITYSGEPAVGGLYWSASVANAVHGWVKGSF